MNASKRAVTADGLNEARAATTHTLRRDWNDRGEPALTIVTTKAIPTPSARRTIGGLLKSHTTA